MPAVSMAAMPSTATATAIAAAARVDRAQQAEATVAVAAADERARQPVMGRARPGRQRRPPTELYAAQPLAEAETEVAKRVRLVVEAAKQADRAAEMGLERRRQRGEAGAMAAASTETRVHQQREAALRAAAQAASGVQSQSRHVLTLQRRDRAGVAANSAASCHAAEVNVVTREPRSPLAAGAAAPDPDEEGSTTTSWPGRGGQALSSPTRRRPWQQRRREDATRTVPTAVLLRGMAGRGTGSVIQHIRDLIESFEHVRLMREAWFSLRIEGLRFKRDRLSHALARRGETDAADAFLRWKRTLADERAALSTNLTTALIFRRWSLLRQTQMLTRLLVQDALKAVESELYGTAVVLP